MRKTRCRWCARRGDLTEEEAWPRNFELAMEVFASKDSIEGATAFAEKREPKLDGHLTRHAVEVAGLRTARRVLVEDQAHDDRVPQGTALPPVVARQVSLVRESGALVEPSRACTLWGHTSSVTL